jgi:hypothetical protein
VTREEPSEPAANDTARARQERGACLETVGLFSDRDAGTQSLHGDIGTRCADADVKTQRARRPDERLAASHGQMRLSNGAGSANDTAAKS